ncbi:polysaccharide biosynthesis protein [Staphylococcus sp. Marseille-Q6910]|uniref:polysaccharide biosynthesis protein n=1 Tax=Staphylococcus sp. Marseille-Q6910 TaxID=2937990 RepID=UPI00203F3026|nr:polysaccharide biosynthesis protein [Staphylococcus sp. Marseille-Q6910]
MKSKSQETPAFNGVIVLTIALVIVKVLSALYRVPYQNILGDAGLYAYQQIYPIVALGVILSMNAIPSAVTQTFASDTQHDRYSKLVVRLQLVGVCFFIIVLLAAKWIAMLMGDIQLTPMLRAASFSFLLVGLLGVYRGYYQSQHAMNTPAISQVIEQFVRVAIIMGAIIGFMSQHWTVYTAGTVAITGSAIGFLASTLFLMLRKPFKITMYSKQTSIEGRKFLLAVVIFAVSQLIVILWQVVDSFTVIHALKFSGLDLHQAMAQKGVYDRGASFIQMGLIVTTTFCFVLIPLLTEAIKSSESHLANHYANTSLKITVTFSVAAGIGLINLLPVMNAVFFKHDSLTVTLSVYMLTVICVSLIMLDIALLQVRERIRPIFIALAISIIAKTILNVALIPYIEMLGGSMSTVLSLVIFVTILHVSVVKIYQFQDIALFVAKLIGIMALLTIAVQVMLFIIPATGRLGGLIELLIAAIVGVLVVVFAIVKLSLLKNDELKHLPLGDKLYELKKGRQ